MRAPTTLKTEKRGIIINTKKSRIFILLIFACLFFSSCENITPQDFGPNDIANILNAVWKKDDPEPETGDPAEPVADSVREEEPVTEKPTEPAEPVSSAAQEEETAETVATVIDIRAVFPDVPEKFAGVQYPESVRMTGLLKKNIKNLSDYSAKDFKGMNFYILTTDSAAPLFRPSYNGEMLNDARRYRTNIVDTECNTVIRTVLKPEDSIFQDIRLSVQSDEFVSDIICVPLDIQSQLIRQGYLMNLKKIPFLNPNAEYYNASATEAFTVNGNIYGLVSDLTFDPSNIYAVFYNKSLVKEYNLTNPAGLYKDGKWDYDGMFHISKELTSAIADLNHDLRWSIGVDKEDADIINGMFLSSGGKYFAKREYNYPVLNFSNEKTLQFIDIISKIIAPPEETGMENYLAAGSWDQNRAFSNGNVLFSVLKLDMIKEITNSEFEWGLLPVPALDSDSDSGSPRSFADSSVAGISVLKGTRNTEACGIVAGALSMASHLQLKDIYVTEQMTYRLRDVDSVKILSDIVGGVAFSQYNAFPAIPEVYGSTAGILIESANKRGNFGDLYENNRKILNDFFKSSQIFVRS